MDRNIEFCYLYRDASNYKEWGSVVFHNPYGFDTCFIDSILKKYFDFGNLFIACQISIPEKFIYIDGEITIDDHCYHEYVEVKETSKESNDKDKRSVHQFMWQVQFMSFKGWDVFDPIERNIFNINKTY